MNTQKTSGNNSCDDFFNCKKSFGDDAFDFASEFDKNNTSSDNKKFVYEKKIYHLSKKFAAQKLLAISNHSFVQMRYIGIPLCHKKNIELDFSGGKLSCEEGILPVLISGCENITLKNAIIDFPNPGMAQAKIISYVKKSASEDSSNSSVANDQSIDDVIGIVVQFEEGATPIVKNGVLGFNRGGVFYPAWKDRIIEIDTKQLSPSNGGGDWSLGCEISLDKTTLIDSTTVKIIASIKRCPPVDSMLVFRFGERDYSGILIENSKNICFENVVIHYADGMAFIAQNSADITLKSCKVIPSGSRLFSAAADATHFVNCSGLVHLENCEFRLQMDDPINVHGIYSICHKLLDDKHVLVGLMEAQQKGVEICSVGDEMNIIGSDSFIKKSNCIVSSVTQLNIDFWIIGFSENLPADLVIGDAFENVTRTCSVELISCKMIGNRARGPLLTSPKKVLMRDCFVSTPGSGVKISGDLHSWYESGSVHDIEISNNVFQDCCGVGGDWGDYMISIDPETLKAKKIPTDYHENICITNNKFLGKTGKILFARSTKNLVFKDNTCDRLYAEADYCIQYCDNPDIAQCKNV